MTTQPSQSLVPNLLSITAQLLFVTAIIVASGCTTFSQRMSRVREAYYASEFLTAETLVHETLKKDRHNSALIRLDEAMIQLAAGQPLAAEQSLRMARDQFEELDGAISSGAAFSYLTDDTRRDYCGEDYELILLRAFLAISNLMHDGGDAEAYSLQMIEKQEQIIANGVDKNGENPKLNYQRVALAPYLRGILREATHRDYDDAERSFAAVLHWRPEFSAARHDADRVVNGHHSSPGNGVLYVFALTGRGPVKEEVVETPSSVSLLMAGEILSAVGKQTVPPNIAPVKVPQVVARRNHVQSVGVTVNSFRVGATEAITDVTQLAIQQYESIYTRVVARAVARRCVKMGVIYGAKEVVGVQKGSLPSLAVDLTGLAWEATESADTRAWGLLPDKIQVLRVELPVGEHDIGLYPLSHHGSAIHYGAVHRIPIADGRNTYMLASFPDRALVGRVLVSAP